MRVGFVRGLAASALFILISPLLGAGTASEKCVIPSACFDVSTDFEPIIKQKVELFRGRAKQARAAGKVVGYLSIPLSTRAGGYFTINSEVANAVESRLKKLYGSDFVFVINPASSEANMVLNGTNASQSDYMYMWAQVLAGEAALGEDIDFVYFSGLKDFTEYWSLKPDNQLAQLGEIFEQRVKTDPKFAEAVSAGKVKKTDFVSYYGLRAGVEFSTGSHDEWNLIAALNARRRANDPKEGIARQISTFFNGSSVPPADAEANVSTGNAKTHLPVSSH